MTTSYNVKTSSRIPSKMSQELSAGTEENHEALISGL